MIFFYEFKRNIVLNFGLLYLLIHQYISLCFSLFEENVALEIGYTLSFDTPLHFLVAFKKKVLTPPFTFMVGSV